MLNIGIVQNPMFGDGTPERAGAYEFPHYRAPAVTSVRTASHPSASASPPQP